MKIDTIYIINCGGHDAHAIAKKLRALGFYSNIVFSETDLRSLTNAKGFILSKELAAIENTEQIKAQLNSIQVPYLEYTNDSELLSFIQNTCSMNKNWDYDTVLESILSQIQKDAGESRKVLLFLSGGVDSTITFALLNKALGQERVLGLHVNNGFMRKNESAIIAERYKNHGFTNFIVEDASETFLKAVYKEVDPQKKRKAVGETYIQVRDEVASRLGLQSDEWLLAQGTLYPDIIESGQTDSSKLIKTHHNCVEGIQALIEQGLIIEPIKYLYKDEVRLIGKKLGLADELVFRHPFPGPGLSINVLCSKGVDSFAEQDKSDLSTAQKEVDSFSFMPFLGSEPQEKRVLPVRSVGVEHEQRTYRFPLTINFKLSVRDLPSWEHIEKASYAITKASTQINRLLLCLWETSELATQKTELRLQEAYCEKSRLDMLREADAIVLEELKSSGWYSKIFQHLTIIIPYSTSTDRCSFVLRPMVSEDVMSARFAHLDLEVLDRIVDRIAHLGFVDAIYFDATNKPPATFGWE